LSPKNRSKITQGNFNGKIGEHDDLQVEGFAAIDSFAE
jgi:hypothetical protein